MATVCLNLINDRWFASSDQSAFIRGTAFVGSVKIDQQDFANFLPPTDGGDSRWQDALLQLNGFFALVKRSVNDTIISVDRIRSIPLFYGCNDETVYVSDDADWLRGKIGVEQMDPVAKDEFQLAGYVTGADTLFRGIKQLQAGELLHIKHGESPAFTTHRWYRFLHQEPATCNKNQLRLQLDERAEASVRRLAEYASGRQIVIPLSGGYDSRLIALLLNRIGYTSVLTFTYGILGNKESQYSKAVAVALGLEWHFVEYSAEMWRALWKTQARKDYQKSASGWSSLPHMQDWPAVAELQKRGVIDDDAVFVPGHSGDFVAGSHIPKDFMDSRSLHVGSLTKAIWTKHFSLVPIRQVSHHDASFWRTRILDRCEVNRPHGCVAMADAFEKWDWQERQAKYIVNSIRVYEFFGYDWWLPQWEPYFVDFWQGVPLKLRFGAAWYIQYVQDVYGKDTGREKVGNGSTSIKGRIAAWIPKFLKKFIKRIFTHLAPVSPQDPLLLLSPYRAEYTEQLKIKKYGLLGIVSDDFLANCNADR